MLPCMELTPSTSVAASAAIIATTSSETLTNVYYPAGEIEEMEAEGLYLDKRVGFDITRYLHPEE